MRTFRNAVSVEELKSLAQRRLPRAVFDFIEGGAFDERTVAANGSDFDKWTLLPRVGVNVSAIDLSVDLFGKRSALPLFVCPTGGAGFYWPDGDQAGARAAATAGIPFCLSINSVASIEEVAEAAPGADLWFQLYFLRDRNWVHHLLERANRSGFRVLCLTLDVPTVGRRERDIRNGYSVPLRPTLANVLSMLAHPRWLLGTFRSRPRFGNYDASHGGRFAEVAKHVAGLIDDSATWDDVAAIRDAWPGAMVVKGILNPDDAQTALRIGVDGIQVSNHGGRQLDEVPSSVAALPAVVEAVAGRVPILVDGGVTRGTSALKAVALGARAVGIGRSWLWGLSTGGEQGVGRALDILRAELDLSLKLLGVGRVESLGLSSLRERGEVPRTTPTPNTLASER